MSRQTPQKKKKYFEEMMIEVARRPPSARKYDHKIFKINVPIVKPSEDWQLETSQSLLDDALLQRNKMKPKKRA